MTSHASPLCIRLGTRSSALARWQADWVAGRLRELGVEVIPVPIRTTGDRHAEGVIGAIGGTGIFTKELQRALVDQRIDLAVHSLKDLPTHEVAGLCLAAVPERGPMGDVLVSRNGAPLSDLARGAVVGTGSLRRGAQLRFVRPDLAIRDIRGNVDTRLRKLDAGQYDALVLAEAGLERLGLAGRVTQRLSPEILLPAVGQGALALETRSDDRPTRSAVQRLGHSNTHAAVVAERSLMAVLHGGCLAPIGAWGRVEEGILRLSARVVHPDASKKVEATLSACPDEAAELGRQVAEALMAQGATELIHAARERLPFLGSPREGPPA
jgi:hydroxymethylbilane synthase